MRIIPLFMALVFAGCASHAVRAYAPDRDVESQSGGTPAYESDAASRGLSAGDLRRELRARELSKAPQMAGDMTRPDRRVIFNASLAVLVADPAAAERDLRKALDEAKGWIHKIDGAVFTLRVPAPLFDPMLDKLAALGRVLERKVAGTDVSEEYRDLELRLKNAEEVRKRLVALLEKARDVKETLEVERELARVSEEIERLKGKLQSMTSAVEHSTIVVSLARREEAANPRDRGRPTYPFPWVRKLGAEALMEFRR